MADKGWIAETLFDELGFRINYRARKCSVKRRPGINISCCSSMHSSEPC